MYFIFKHFKKSITFVAKLINKLKEFDIMSKIKFAVNIFWFRRDLRIEDNVGLFHALNSDLNVLPLFIFDTNILSKIDDKSDKRVNLIRNILLNLQVEFAKNGSTLLVKYGNPVEVFDELTKDYDVNAVFTNRDYEPYALVRDKEVENLLDSKNIRFKSFKDQVIFEWNEVLKSDGSPYTIFTPFSKIWKHQISPKHYHNYLSESFLSHTIKCENIEIPELKEIGFIKNELPFTKAVIDLNIIKNYADTRNFPSVDGTSDLSVHLRFGTISIRKLVSIAIKTNEIWLNELIWREFFMAILMHFPYVENGAFKKKYDQIPWLIDENGFKLWCEGKTGYPIVDAGMRQLNATGLMHNRVRMIVASFLTKDLLIDWRWGEAYFAQKLLDYDLSANNGNWQWAAGCGCDAAPYFRIFNPAEQTKRYDPELKYINKWVDDLNSFDYPKPIVEHTFARDRALKTYKLALNDTN